MKKSFTLIEVLIATILVFITSITVLSSIGNTKKLIQMIQNNKIFYLKASLITNEYNKNGQNLYEYVNDFNIDNDIIIKNLKSTKYEYNLKTIKYISLPKYKEVISKLEIYDKYHSLVIYKLDIK